MLNMQEIEKEIHDLENCDKTTYPVCEKLAILYTVKDHYKGGNGGTETSGMSKMMSLT